MKNIVKKIDIVAVIILYILIFTFNIISYNIFYQNKIVDIIGIGVNSRIFNMITSILILLILCIYFKIRKLSIKDFNMTFNKNKKSIIVTSVGIVLSFLIVFLRIVITNQPLTINHSLKESILHFFYILFIVSLYEEIVFRLFIHNVLKSKIKKEWIALLLGGIMFSFIHIIALISNVPQMGYVSFFDVIKYNIFNFVFLFGLHIVLSKITDECENLLPAVVIHFMYDYLQFLFI